MASEAVVDPSVMRIRRKGTPRPSARASWMGGLAHRIGAVEQQSPSFELSGPASGTHRKNWQDLVGISALLW